MEVASKNKRNQLEIVDPSRQLVEQASAGCSDSFRQLVEQNHQLIRLYLGNYVQCSSQVDDLAQEVFVVAYCHIDHFNRRSKFSTWLVGIARNKALEFLRAEKKAKKIQKQFFEAEIASRQITRLETQHQESEFAERRLVAMQLCLGKLKDRSRKLIDLYYFKQQSAAIIAAESKISAGSVRMRLLRIRQVLQKCIVTHSQDRSDNQSLLEFDNE